MRSFLCEGTGGKWAIEWEDNPWGVRRACVRSNGRDGTLLLFKTKEEADAHIASMNNRDYQEVLDHAPAPKVRKAKEPDA